jgi:hypothetical protein
MLFLSKNKGKASSRKQIQIKEVNDGVLVLPNKEYRVAIETSSVNFELKSEEEQDVIIDSFENFLNSLPCKLQILVRVREIDIDHYLNKIRKLTNHETQKIYQEEIENYCSFVQSVVSGNKILSRRFYIIIPYKDLDGAYDFSLIKEQIHLNRDIVMRGLEKLGMKSKQLNSLELIDLFYSFYNPDEHKIKELKNDAVITLFQNTTH